MQNYIHVAVGVIINEKDEVLIALRPSDKDQGGLWEFAGGKKEETETIELALEREFAEELDIKLKSYFPLLKIKHSYEDVSVLLDVWMITDYIGTPKGLEGQRVEWRSLKSLECIDFPAANKKIIRSIKLPKFLPITPDLGDLSSVKKIFKTYNKQQIELVQFRQTHLNANEYLSWFKDAQTIAKEYSIELIFNGDIKNVDLSEASGFHANSRRLMQMSQRPIVRDKIFGASCHNLIELKKAMALDADYVSLSPVLESSKYDDFSLGWSAFKKLAYAAYIPVYALGGVGPNDLKTARSNGSYGVSGISSWFNRSEI